MKIIFYTIIISLILFSCKTKENSLDKINSEVENNFSASDSDKNETEDFYTEERIEYADKTYIETIKTVELHASNWVHSEPVIYLDQNNTLTLSFDDLSTNVKDFYYTFIYCDAMWNPVDMLQQEYLDGFFDEQINDFKLSVNTLQNYIHYECVLPSENMKPSKSGNYLLKVWYKDKNEDITAFTRRMFVSEQSVSISATVKAATNVELRNYQHEIDFEVNTNELNIINPYNSVTVILRQNSRYDNMIDNLKPKFVNGKILDYNYEAENIFNASNEFRHFDIKSMNYYTDHIAKIERKDGQYHIYLKQDFRRPYQKYISDDDIEGAFFIKNDDRKDGDYESEYVWVHFNLSYPNPLSEGSLYLGGAFTNWQYDNTNKLVYNYETKSYTDSLYLKQGYYNYLYTFLPNQKNVGDDSFVEGRHFEADNNYSIYVYYRPEGELYDRLTGVMNINSNNK